MDMDVLPKPTTIMAKAKKGLKVRKSRMKATTKLEEADSKEYFILLLSTYT